MNSPFMISQVPLEIIILVAHSTLGESSFMNSTYMIYKAPFTSAALPAHITVLPHEQHLFINLFLFFKDTYIVVV